METLRRRYLFVIFFVWTVLAVDHVKAYSSGAPDSPNSCTTLLPVHDKAIPQMTEMPYNVFIDGAPNNGSYDAKTNHTVTLSGKNGTTFRGFILQARQYATNTNFTTFGSFLTPGNAKATCGSVGGATVTHRDGTDKTSIEFTWIAPSNAAGTVQFRGTIVKVKTTFWEIPQPPPPATTGEPPVPIDRTECGRTKGCYFSNCPDPNDPNHCDYGVTWSAAGPDGTAFELFASATYSLSPYVALGLSHDKTMGDDSVTDCIYNQVTGGIDVQMSFNTGRSNSVLDNETLSLVNGSMSGSFSDGMLICRFTRLKYPSSAKTRSKRQTEDIVFYPGSDIYYILIAKGAFSSGIKGQHPFEPAVSTLKVNFSQFLDLSESPSLSPLIKAHGIMMIFAWMVIASFGILMPRYYKTAWPGKTWGGKAIWFQLHQPLMSITLILTAAAFILIFIEVQGYSQLQSPAVAHPPLGIVVMALVVINPIMAVFRPDPKAERRWIFNILHFLVGLLAHLSAAVTLFLAMYITKLEMPQWCRWVMVGYICWHAFIEIILAIHMHVTLRKMKKATKEELAMQSIQDPTYEDPNESKVESYSLFRTVLAVLHLAGVLGCAIALSVQIGIS